MDRTASRYVLIVGGGPTGLTLANDLAGRGVPFRIIDTKPGITNDSKGLALNVSSLYAYRLIGLEAQVSRRANRISRFGIFWGAQRYSRINFDRLPHDIDALVTQPQSQTESELLSALQAAGAQVDWSHQLLSAEENHGDVRVSLALPDGRVVAETYRYVVGCDGKHSAVRQALGASFDGSDYAMHFVLGDFRLDVDWPRSEVQYRVHADGFFILVPIGHGLWRIVVKYDGAPPARKPAASDITDVIERYLGHGLVTGQPAWLSRAPFYHRVAGHLCSRRLFIAGDAAHLFSPIGGTGMNTGIQDVVNLGWKLAFHYHGYAHEGILQTYQAERLPVIRSAATIADLSTRLIAGTDWRHQVIADMAPIMANRSKLRHLFPVTHAGMAMRLELAGTQGRATAGVGALNATFLDLVVPHLQCRDGEQWRNAFHCIVNLQGMDDNAASRASLMQLRERLLAARHLRMVYLGDSNARNLLAPWLASSEQVITLGPVALRRIGAAPAVVFVRPDGITVHETCLQHDIDVDSILSPYLCRPVELATEAAVS